MERQSMTNAAVIGGVIAGVASAIPGIHCLCCLIPLGGGILASYFYIKGSALPIRSGDGAVLGLLAGVIAGVVTTIVGIPIRLIFGTAAFALVRDILSAIPNVPYHVLDRFSNHYYGWGLLGIFARGFFSVITFAIFSTVGGILGVALFEKRDASTPPAGQPPVPPTPPEAP